MLEKGRHNKRKGETMSNVIVEDQWSPSVCKVVIAAKGLDPTIIIDSKQGDRLLLWMDANDLQLEDLLGGYHVDTIKNGIEEIKAFAAFKVRETPFHIWSFLWVDKEYESDPGIKVMFESIAHLLGRLQYDAFQRQGGKQAFPVNWIETQDLTQLASDIRTYGGAVGYAQMLLPDYVKSLIVREASKQTGASTTEYLAALENILKHFGGEPKK